MVKARVCTNCGWHKRIRRGDDDTNRYCPRCTSVTHVVAEGEESSFNLVLITAAIVFAIVIFGCPLTCVAAIFLRSM